MDWRADATEEDFWGGQDKPYATSKWAACVCGARDVLTRYTVKTIPGRQKIYRGSEYVHARACEKRGGGVLTCLPTAFSLRRRERMGRRRGEEGCRPSM